MILVFGARWRGVSPIVVITCVSFVGKTFFTRSYFITKIVEPNGQRNIGIYAITPNKKLKQHLKQQQSSTENFPSRTTTHTILHEIIVEIVELNGGCVFVVLHAHTHTHAHKHTYRLAQTVNIAFLNDET